MKTTLRMLLACGFVLASLVCISKYSFAQTMTPTSSSSDVPHTISYQGLLQSSDGMPMNGLEQLTVRLYADTAGQDLVWEDTYTTNVRNGIFNVLLGSQKPLPGNPQMSTALWLATKIGESEEMKPYSPMSASPYALTVANGAITPEKMGTDYVGAIYVNGTKVTARGSSINLQAGEGLSVSYDPISR